MSYTDFIGEVLKEASVIARKNFGKVKGRTKPDDNNQVLTDTDIEIGNFIIAQISREFPKQNIIDEEAGVIDKGSEFTWVVDPIDGTSNFAVGVETYGTMIGLLKNRTPIAGGLSLPSFYQIITAEKGKGAFLNGKKISVTSEKDLSKTLVAFGIDSRKEDPEKTRKEMRIASEIVLSSRNLRSSNSVFDVVMLAKGAYSCYISQSGRIWDHVAPLIVIEEAGGIYTDYYGKKMDFSKPLTKIQNRYSVCASTPILHKKLQEIIHSN